MADRWANNGNGDRLYLFALQNHCRCWLQLWNKKTLAPWEKSYDQPRQHIKQQRPYFAKKFHLVKAMFFPVVMYGCDTWTMKKAEQWRIDAFELWCWIKTRFWESLNWKIKPVNPKENQSWIFIGRTDAEAEAGQHFGLWCEELTHWKRPWCWKRLKAGGDRDDRGWDGWMALLTRWAWVWAISGSWWRTGKPGVLQPMGLQRVGHN